jgi:anaerobic magnesium-protoporphyrin IX monomethyl ester cyclase
MSALKRVLLVNPTITSRRSSRFPLSLLALAGSLENTHASRIVDGNIDRDYLATLKRALAEEHYDAVGVSVMGGPQVKSAIDASRAVRELSPAMPVIWGGYFPTLYPDAALNAPYLDYAVRGPGEAAFSELLSAINTGDALAIQTIPGISWKRGEQIVHNPDRKYADRRSAALLPYDLLGDPRAYLVKTFLGSRTAAHQAAMGCRFRCTFCGVAAMFGGATTLPHTARLERDLKWLKENIGADSLQFVDHNFFDREADMVPILEVLSRIQLPWWCYARADALLNLSANSWTLARKSRMRMAYIGAESPNDAMLKSIRKGTTSNQTLEVADLCRHQGVIPELSFMVAPPVDTESETERTFEFIREIKRVNPDSEVIVYIYTPLPAQSLPANSRARASVAPLFDLAGNPLQFPATPEEWTEKRWVDYSCHADAPWLTDQLRKRIKNFVTVLGCRFPTVQDVAAPAWTKMTLKAMASWRYRFCRYDRPWELTLSKKLIRLADPKVTSI